MSVRQYSVACDLEDDRLNATDKAVLLILANHADSDGKHCFPSVPTIAKKAWASERSVQRSLKSLASCGHLKVQRGTGHTHSEYELTLPQMMLKAFDAKLRKRQEVKTVGKEQDKIVKNHFNQLTGTDHPF